MDGGGKDGVICVRPDGVMCRRLCYEDFRRLVCDISTSSPPAPEQFHILCPKRLVAF